MSFFCSFKWPCGAQTPSVGIKIKNSCNFVCCLRRNARVYVNSFGEAELFDPRKANNEREAMQRSITNLQKTVDALIEAYNAESDYESIKGRVQLIVPSDSPTLTVRMLENVNIILNNAMSPRSSKHPKDRISP